MSDEVTAERIAVVAAAARVPLEPSACARVARAVAPTVARVAAERIALPFEVEPSSFTTIARREIGR